MKIVVTSNGKRLEIATESYGKTTFNRILNDHRLTIFLYY